MPAGDAMRVAIAACVANSDAPVLLSMEKGVGGRPNALLGLMARKPFAAALSEAREATDEVVEAAFSALVAAAVDLRRAQAEEAAGLFDFLTSVDDDETVRLRFAKHFDYAAYFRAAGRAVSLDALRACGGKAAESERAWMKDEPLAEQAAMMARASRWTPDYLGIAR